MPFLLFLQNVYKHPFCRLFFCFQYNLTPPHYPKKNGINLNKIVIKLILEFLTKRPQYVKINNEQNGNGLVSGVVSKTIWTNTGAPQGAVLSPLLLTAYK